VNSQFSSPENAKSIRHGIYKSPDWKNAAIKSLHNGKAVLVPIKYNKNLFLKVSEDKNDFISLNSLSYLLISTNKKNDKVIEWVTFIPTNSNNYQKNGNKFRGKVIIENWNGNFKKAYLFENDGKIYHLKLENKNNNSVKTLSDGIKVAGTYCFQQPWYGENIADGESYWYLGGYDTYCFSTGNSYNEQTHAENEVGGGHSEVIPEDYQPPFIYRDVVNNLNNVGADCIYNRLQSNALFQELLSSFQSNANLNVTFQMGYPVDKNGNPVNGQTSHDLGTTNFTITIDNDYLSLRGGIEVAKTFLHEAFHANLYTQAQLWYPTDLPNDFQNWSLVDQIKYIDNRSGSVAGFSNSHHHNFMATQIDKIANGIKDYTQANYPTIFNNPNATFDSYRAMAYLGLTGTECYSTYISSLPNGQASFNAAYQELISIIGENKCP
ncbi:hypothetical protein, partial [Pedobacter alpinus]|uniref:hypothetical protein n=1 Tax=Pedobacter alpinus TaxID=1590643 RepID=UPI003606788E